MGLRDEKKIESKSRIIEAGKELFEVLGFKKTTTAKIARTAKVGEGTLYNYFPSKSELFLEIYFSKHKDDIDLSHIQRPNDMKELVKIVVEIIDYYLSDLTSISKPLLKDYFSISYNIFSGDNLKAQESLIDFDEIISKNLENYIKLLKNEDIIHYEVDESLIVDIVLSSMIRAVTSYVLTEDYNYDDLLLRLTNLVSLVFVGNFIIK